jgi:hypothetical protein
VPPAPEEVDVADLQRSRLSESEAAESADGDEGGEPVVRSGEQRADLGRRGDARGVLAAPAVGECHPVAGVGGDHPVTDGAAQDGAHVLHPGVDGARSQAGRGHLLDPRLHVRAAEQPELDVLEAGAPNGEAHRQLGARSPDLAGGPGGVEGRHGDAAGLGIDVHAGDDRCGDLVEPALGVGLLGEVPGVLLAFGVAVPGAPGPVGTPRDACHASPRLLDLPRRDQTAAKG